MPPLAERIKPEASRHPLRLLQVSYSQASPRKNLSASIYPRQVHYATKRVRTILARCQDAAEASPQKTEGGFILQASGREKEKA